MSADSVNTQFLRPSPIPSKSTIIAALLSYFTNELIAASLFTLFPDLFVLLDSLIFSLAPSVSRMPHRWEQGRPSLGSFICTYSFLMLCHELLFRLSRFLLCVSSKWILLGKMREGTFEAGSSYLVRYELVHFFVKQFSDTMHEFWGSFAQIIWMKCMGGGSNISWTWIPSWPKHGTVMSADLINIKPDSFCANNFEINCVSVTKLPNGMQQFTCKKAELCENSFVGPGCVVLGGAKIGSRSATMDYSFIPAGYEVSPGKTLIGLGPNRIQARRRTDVDLVEPVNMVLPFNLAVTCVVFLCQQIHIGNILLLQACVMQLWISLRPLFSQGIVRFFTYMWVSVVALMFVASMCSMFGAVLLKRLLLQHAPSHIAGPYRGWMNIQWVATHAGGCILLDRWISAWVGTPVLSLLARGFGCKCGKNVSLGSTFIMHTFPELDIHTLEDNTHVDGVSYGHLFGSGALRFKGNYHKKNSVVRRAAVVSPGALVGEGTVVQPLAVVLPNVPERVQSLCGNPAAPGRTRWCTTDPIMTYRDAEELYTPVFGISDQESVLKDQNV